MERYGGLDSKFRFVILASKRAKQLLHGAKPKIKVKSKNLIRIAQAEVKAGLIDYEIVQPQKKEAYKPEDEIFIGEEISEEEGIKASDEEKPKKDVGKKPKGKKKKTKSK